MKILESDYWSALFRSVLDLRGQVALPRLHTVRRRRRVTQRSQPARAGFRQRETDDRRHRGSPLHDERTSESTPAFPVYRGELPARLNPLNPRHYLLLAYWIFCRPTALKYYLYRAAPEVYRNPRSGWDNLWVMLRIPAYHFPVLMAPVFERNADGHYHASRRLDAGRAG